MVAWSLVSGRVRKQFGAEFFTGYIQGYDITRAWWRVIWSDRGKEDFNASVLVHIWFGPPLPRAFYLAFGLSLPTNILAAPALIGHGPESDESFDVFPRSLRSLQVDAGS